jgi:solute carrier family 35 (UDP-xylose/UDP-N-acetylglucosamine transporter), member B4
LVTFSQFFFIACHGLVFTSKFFKVKPVIAMKDYFTLVVLFFLSSVCNNYAFNFNIPMPLHMIFRAGSLMANMIMGMVILQKSYDSWKYSSVSLITVGIIICTIASGATLDKPRNAEAFGGFGMIFWWSIGILLLTVALFVSARMGIYQEMLFKKYGKHPNEALFYTHIIPLPGFLLLYKSIQEHFIAALYSESQSVLGLFNMPVQIAYLIGNMLTQSVCISSVYILTTECPSLTVTLVVTLRKFASLLFSIIFFKNQFTFYHWIGTAFVFLGTVIYTEMFPKLRNSLRCKSWQGNEIAGGKLLSNP